MQQCARGEWNITFHPTPSRNRQKYVHLSPELKRFLKGAKVGIQIFSKNQSRSTTPILNQIGHELAALLGPEFSIQFSISHDAKNVDMAASNNRINSRFVGNTAYMSHTMHVWRTVVYWWRDEASPAAKGRYWGQHDYLPAWSDRPRLANGSAPCFRFLWAERFPQENIRCPVSGTTSDQWLSILDTKHISNSNLVNSNLKNYDNGTCTDQTVSLYGVQFSN